MEDNARQDIRRLLKSFGIQADEAIMAHLAQLPEGTVLQLRVTLEDVTDYGGNPPTNPLQLEIEGEVKG
ncbi:MAG: hypothetical protein KC434_20890 [Anaerolineales bacterium]|nr:hypothetical protein [Anaerolineales bacterium]